MSPVASPRILNIVVLPYLNFVGLKSLNYAQFCEIHNFGGEEEEVKPCGRFLYQSESFVCIQPYCWTRYNPYREPQETNL